MEETAIRPGYTIPTRDRRHPGSYSAIEAAVNAHNQNTQPGSLLGHPAMRDGV